MHATGSGGDKLGSSWVPRGSWKQNLCCPELQPVCSDQCWVSLHTGVTEASTSGTGLIVYLEWQCWGTVQFMWNLDASLVIESNGVLILHLVSLTFSVWASLYNFQCFPWKKKKSKLRTTVLWYWKEFLIIFVSVCWFEIAVPRRSLHFRVTFFLYLIY